MAGELHGLQPFVKPLIAERSNDAAKRAWHALRMGATRIHQGKTSRRRHYLAEWMELRGVRPADITEAVGADKGLISRWLNKGVCPGPEYLEALAGFLGAKESVSLLRHPDDDWLAKFFRERGEADRARARAILEAAFPKKVA